MSSARYLLKRLLVTVAMIWIAVTLIWVLFRLLPGGYENIMAMRGAGQAEIQAFREHWGLDDPYHVQYYRYLVNLINLEMGTSIRFGKPVWEVVQPKIMNTFVLIAPSITLAYLIGSALGAVMGDNREGWLDRYLLVPILAVGWMPSFFLGILGILIFSLTLGWLPPAGMLSPGTASVAQEGAWWEVYLTNDFLRHWILPASVVCIRWLYFPLLLMRTNMVEVKGQPFAFYQRMTGLPYYRRLKHLVHHASLPVITMYPISMTRALSGIVLIELVFNWPGIALTLVESVFSRDAPVVQFVLILVAIFIILANLVVDFVYMYVDPRITLE